MDIDRDTPSNHVAHCNNCLDLQHRLFWPLSNGHTFLLTNEDLKSRLRYVTFNGIEESAADGCLFCSILKQGIDQLWPFRTDRTFAPRSTESRSDGHDLPDELSWNLCIESRPGRSLLVSRVDRECFEPMMDDGLCSSHFCFQRTWKTPIEFFTPRGVSPAFESFGPSGAVPTTLEDNHIRKVLKSWLSECDAEHSACGTGDVIINQAYPKRLVQVAGGIVRLVELPWDSTETYMTLSHCWGSKSDDVLRTLSTNITSMRQSIDWDEIPPTFQDAIRITRLMQCDFIWIDSLCIIQDDKSDWEDHAAQMAGIYSNSYLNIAATASKNPFQGFLSARTWTANLPHEADTRPLKSYSLSCNVVARPHLHQAHQAFFSSDERKLDLLQHDHVPLLRRAWVFQERMLSRRTLHFTGSEMIWECRDRTLCECGDYNVWPETGNFKNYFAQEISESTFPGDLGALFVWEACVQEFTSLDISDPSDWPQAFAGLATRFAPHLQSNYVAGLWEREFAVCLTWFAGLKRHRDPIRRYSNPEKWPFHAYSPKGPPTWSWLNCRAAATTFDRTFYNVYGYGSTYSAAESRFKFDFGDPGDLESEKHEVELRVDVKGKPLFLEGAVRKGRIRVFPDPTVPEIKLEDGADLDEAVAKNIWFDFQPPDSKDAWLPIICLLVTSSSTLQIFLVLAAFPGEDFYIRIGTGLAGESTESLFDDAEVCRVEVR